MPRTLDPFRLLLCSVAGWMNHQQQQIIAYLREENRILHAQLGTRRLRFDDEQRRRLAVLRKAIREFLVHYHLERNHQGLGNRLITPQAIPVDANGTIQRRQRLSGMLNYYYRAA